MQFDFERVIAKWRITCNRSWIYRSPKSLPSVLWQQNGSKLFPHFPLYCMQLILRLKEVIAVTKEKTALVIPNAIEVSAICHENSSK